MNDSFMKEKPILPLFISMALPMVISMLVNSLYNIVDSFFVAQINEQAMTALSLVYPVQNLINAVAIGYGVGISAVISIFLGEENHEKANITATQGLLFAIIHGFTITILSIAVMPAFLNVFTNDETVIEYGTQYSVIVFSFSTVIMAGLSFEKIFQSVGKMKVTMIGLLCGCISNIILDPLLIWGIGIFPEMGISEAALATGIGQVITLLIYLVIYKIRPLPVKIKRPYLSPDKQIILRLYGIGVPAILNLALPSLLISCLNSILSAYSQSYVLILGVYYKLQTFIYLPANGIVQGMRPLIGYNFGAGEFHRVKRIYSTALCMSCGIMVLGTVVCLVAPEQLMSLFTHNQETVLYGKTALRIISAGFIVSAISVTSSGALEGLGKGIQSLVISLFRYVIIILPCAYILCFFTGPTGVWTAFAITEITTGIISIVIYKKAVRLK